ncbi:hypothetical protein [Massilia sp. IC2-476]|uniref:hypothetical protein n=1 Tax=Massilia sp. IC2-476 TaxID=2887199 RepID=UPI001D101F46|nr:hypothetical protein [Massilia sp. IC2-476]MCC2972918.1 hypothetical protein [Massilia sp. IC2-476]
MDIFALWPDRPGYAFITEEAYFSSTQRRQPWATETRSLPKRPLYLATCPECKNAIEIRELDRIRGENDRDPTAPFGKHYKHDVPGLRVTYNQDAYDNCSLRGKVSLSSSEPRKNKEFNAEILRLLVENAAVVHEVIAAKFGIRPGAGLYEKMLKNFIEQARYECKGVLPSNLPFALMYWNESQSLIRQTVTDTEMQDAITKSRHFCLDGRTINSRHWQDAVLADPGLASSKPDWGPHRIAFFMGGRVHRGNELTGEPNHMTMTITEHIGNAPKGTPIHSKKIEYSNRHFPNAIASFERRLTGKDEDAERGLAKKIKWGNIAYKYAKPLLAIDWMPSWLSAQ